MYQFINSLKINKLSGEFVLTRHKLETLKCMNRSYTVKRGVGGGGGGGRGPNPLWKIQPY